MLLWSSLFLEGEEIFVEFIDCPLFYCYTDLAAEVAWRHMRDEDARER